MRLHERNWRYISGLTLLFLGVLLLLCAGAIRLTRGDLEQADQISSVVSAVIGGFGLIAAVVGIAVTFVVGRRPSSPPVTAAAVPPRLPQGEEDGTVGDAPLGSAFSTDLERLRITLAVVHDRLFGVETIIETIGDLLSHHAGARIVSVWGGPGVGKTTLAYEVVKTHAQAVGFARVFGVSAKFRHIDPLGNLRGGASRPTRVDWRDPLVELARQIDPAVNVEQETVERMLPQLFPALPCLAVIDNLETVDEANRIVAYLADRFANRPHRFLVTTRKSVAAVGEQVAERPWDGPSASDAKRFARHLAQAGTALNPSEADLDQIVEIAERTPLLIQIIVSVAKEKALRISQVIATLRDVGGAGRGLWTYCFADAMRSLADGVGSERVAAQLMAVFCFPGRSVTDDEFFRLCRIDDYDVFAEARAIACRLTLVQAMDGNTRFTVHPLLREHFCAGFAQAQ